MELAEIPYPRGTVAVKVVPERVRVTEPLLLLAALTKVVASVVAFPVKEMVEELMVAVVELEVFSLTFNAQEATLLLTVAEEAPV